MKTNRNLWMAMSAALLLAIPFIATSQSAQVPGSINYQGRLTDTLGNAVPSGYYEIKFLLWDDAVQSDAGDLVWGRTFALHVVTNGLFNIQLTDDGTTVSKPHTPTTEHLLDAFEGPRWLGLTIVVSNNVSTGDNPPEISPRQQLVSSPFAITAQNVIPLGVTEAMLTNSAVSTAKIANSAVTTAKIADSAVTTAKIADNAVTTAKIASSAVVTAKIADGAVTLPKIGFKAAVLNADQTFTGQNSFTDSASFSSSSSPVIHVSTEGTENDAAKFQMDNANLIIRSLASSGAVIENTASANNRALLLNPSGGRVGIGTSDPGFPLSVVGYTYDPAHTDQQISIYCNKKVLAYNFNQSSDARIKEVMDRSDSRQDLQTLLGIEITDYKMKDRVTYGDEQFKKVIAQQVEQVYPQAVSSGATEVVPDIYTHAQAKAGWIPLEKKPQPGLVCGDKVRLIAEGHPQLFDVEEANASGFRVKSTVNGPVFVYGRQVHDFRSVDYSAISMLNVSATQELYRRLVASEQVVANLREQNQDLQARVAEMEAREAKQQARFTALERLVHESRNGIQQASLK